MPSPRESKRILLLCQHFFPEMISTGMHMTELAKALGKQGWRITVCCAQPSLLMDSSNPKVASRLEYEGISVVRVPSLGSHEGGLQARLLFALSYLVSSIWFVFRHHRQFCGLLVTTNPPFLGLAGWLATRLLSLPYIWIVYDIYPDIAVRLGRLGHGSFAARTWDWLSGLIANASFANVVIGRDMGELLRRKVARTRWERITLIPNWSDETAVFPVPRATNRFRQEHCGEARFVIQYSGRLASTHNLEPLIEAADLLRDRPVMFQFIGDGAKRQRLVESAAKKKLKKVQFLPYQPVERLGEVLSAADLAVVCLGGMFTGLSVPSKAYGIMASGTPMLGLLDEGSEIGRTIIENDCGLVLEDATGGRVAESVEQLMADPERLARMGRNGYQAFQGGYTLTRSAEKYGSLLDALSSR